MDIVKNLLVVDFDKKFTNQINEYFNKFISKNEQGENHFDLGKIIAMPESINIISDSNEPYFIAAYLCTLKKIKLEDTLIKMMDRISFISDVYILADAINLLPELNNRALYLGLLKTKNPKTFLPSPIKSSSPDLASKMENFKNFNVNTSEEVGKLYVENLMKFSSFDWYGWTQKNWGCIGRSGGDFNFNLSENLIIEFYTKGYPPFKALEELKEMITKNNIPVHQMFLEFSNEENPSDWDIRNFI